ncbi:unnamed protein product [Cuscuta campestris]|uniref:Uncharacterized protein n=1 Tax=Cuscuta campestris TaxID=132261 RepID=A0A484N519_9ASTE|nr:unnamed protein product [Cuscuta campestris]
MNDLQTTVSLLPEVLYLPKFKRLTLTVKYQLWCVLLSNKLSKELYYHYGGSYLPSSLILKALATQKCIESMFMECLDLQGETILKYALSCNLFNTLTKMKDTI